MSPGYAAIVALHVLSAVIGFGAIGTTGVYARSVRSCSSMPSLAAQRFFAEGTNRAARLIYFVPIFGALLLLLGHGQDVHKLFPWIGLGLWSVAVAMATALVWPSEHEIQQGIAVARQVPRDRAVAAIVDIKDAARRCETGAAIVSLCFVAALVVMIAQP